MSSISFKGILLGVLVDLIANMALGIALVVVFAAPYQAEDFEKLANFTEDLLGGGLVLAASGAISVGTGYVAAYVAGRGELINGMLCGLLASALAAGFGSALGAAGWTVLDIIGFAAGPLLGLLGGYLLLRQVRARASAAAQA